MGNVNQGVNPSDLSQTVAPTVDLVPFWGVEKTLFRVAAASVAHTIGQGVEMLVPFGELWVPLVVSADSFNLAGQDGLLAIHVTDEAGNARPVIAQSAYQADTGVTARVSCGTVISQRFIMAAGTRFRAEWNSVLGPATNSTMSIDLMYWRVSS